MKYKEHLPIIRGDDISNLKECLVTEITVKMKNVSSRVYIGPLAKTVNSSSPFYDSLDVIMNNILERNLILLHRLRVMLLITFHRLRVILKLLTNLPILQTIYLPAWTLFFICYAIVGSLTSFHFSVFSK